MPTTPLLGIQELTTNQSGKEATINNAILALESATNATLAVDMSAGNVTLSAAQFGGSFIFKTTGLTANRILNLPAQINGTNVQRIFAVRNTSAFSATVQVTGGAGTSIIVPAGETRLLDVDGAGNVKQVALLSSATSVITDATTARAISLTDASAYIRMNNAAANTVTLPSDATAAIPVGSRIFVERMGAGATSFVAGGGATVSTPASLILRAQFSLGIATKVAANTWVVDGDLSGTGIVSVLDDLTDVDTSTTPPADGQALVYNLASTKWKPGSVASSGGGGGGSMALIQRIVATGTETSIDFTGIPADYKHLRIVACGRTAAAATTDSLLIRLNGDATAADYQTQQLQGANAVASAVANPAANNYFGDFAGATATANQAGVIDAFFPLYSDTHFIKEWQGQNSVPGFPLTKVVTGRWNAVTAVNQITLVPNSGSTIVAGSTFELYGIQPSSSSGTSIDRARAYLNTAANTVSGAWTKAPIDTVDFDNNSIWDATTKRITPKKAGYYAVNTRLRTNTSGAFVLSVGKNGAVNHAMSNDSTNDFACAGSTIIYCNGTTDYLELFYFAGSVRAFTTGSFDSQLEVYGPLSGVGSGQHWYYAPPLASDFTTTTTGTAVNPVLSDDADTGFGIAWGTDALVAGDVSKGCFKALPAGVDWTLECKFNYMGQPLNWQYGGISLRNAASGKSITLYQMLTLATGAGSGPSPSYNLLRQTGNSAQVSQGTPGYTGVDELFFKIVYSNAGATITFYVSKDGKRWVKWFVETLATYLTAAPDQIGFKIISANANAATDIGAVLTCERWKQSW
jgi:hypothetical protein